MVCLPKDEMSIGETYTALSRVRALKNLMIENDFNEKRFGISEKRKKTYD